MAALTTGHGVTQRFEYNFRSGNTERRRPTPSELALFFSAFLNAVQTRRVRSVRIPPTLRINQTHRGCVYRSVLCLKTRSTSSIFAAHLYHKLGFFKAVEPAHGKTPIWSWNEVRCLHISSQRSYGDGCWNDDGRRHSCSLLLGTLAGVEIK